MRQSRHALLVVLVVVVGRVVVVGCALSLLYCLLSAAIISDRTTHSILSSRRLSARQDVSVHSQMQSAWRSAARRCRCRSIMKVLWRRQTSTLQIDTAIIPLDYRVPAATLKTLSAKWNFCDDKAPRRRCYLTVKAPYLTVKARWSAAMRLATELAWRHCRLVWPTINHFRQQWVVDVQSVPPATRPHSVRQTETERAFSFSSCDVTLWQQQQRATANSKWTMNARLERWTWTERCTISVHPTVDCLTVRTATALHVASQQYRTFSTRRLIKSQYLLRFVHST